MKLHDSYAQSILFTFYMFTHAFCDRLHQKSDTYWDTKVATKIIQKTHKNDIQSNILGEVGFGGY